MHIERSIKNRKVAFISLCIVLVYAGLSIAVYTTIYEIMRAKNIQILTEKVNMVREIVSIFNETSKKGAKRISDVFLAMFTGRITLDRSTTMKIQGIDTPILMHNGQVLNLNNSYVNRLSEITGGSVATIFVKKDDDFVRIATSLRREDGSIAVGSTLGRGHPGYTSLIKGETYTGKANLFGRDYMTRYIPIKADSGEVIGLFFVGYDITDALKSLVQYIMSIQIAGKGFFFIIDENNEKTHNTLLVHLTEDTQKGNRVLGEIVKNKEGILHIKDDSFINLRFEPKTLVYAYYKDWNWIIGLGVNTDMVIKEIVIIRNIMLVVGLLLLVLVCSFFILGSQVK